MGALGHRPVQPASGRRVQREPQEPREPDHHSERQLPDEGRHRRRLEQPPDILASDVVYTPNYTKQGLFQDITAELKALPYYDSVAKSHLAVASVDGKTYAVPHKLDSSVLFYNKDLFKQAGLDPAKPPKTFADILADARKITALGNGITGFDIAGSCGGCGVYTLFPYAWADGVKVLSDDGKKVDINNDTFKQIFGLYRQLTAEKLVASSDKTQDGSTWPNNFLAGRSACSPSARRSSAPCSSRRCSTGASPH